MGKILNENLTGRIKELHAEHNLEFYVTDNLPSAKKWIEQIRDNVNNSIAVDIETSGFDGVRNDMLGIVLAISLKKSVYITVRNWSDSEIIELINLINSLPNNKIAHNMFFDVSFIKLRYKVTLNVEKDTMIYAYCLFTDRVYYNKGIGLKDLSREFTPYGDYEEELMEYKKLYCRENKIKMVDFSYDMFPDDVLCNYALMDGVATIYLYNYFEKIKNQFISDGWHKLEKLIETKHKITYIYIDMSVNGFMVDRNRVYELKNEWENRRDILQKELTSLPEIKIVEKAIKKEVLKKAQEKRKSLLPLSRCKKLVKEASFNLNSNDHKKILFYDVLNLKVIEKTDKGQPATGASVISYYSERGNEFMQKLDEYVRLNKGITSFIGDEEEKGLLGFTTDTHPYVHPNYNHCGVVSSRTACSSPNLLQFPSRFELKKLKQCMVVPEGRKLIGFDYSSCEVMVVSALSKEPNFLDAIKNGWDFHSNTAYNVFKEKMVIPVELTDKKQILDYIKKNYSLLRQYSKGCLFGLIYGIQEGGLSKNLGVTKSEAKEIIDSFFMGNKTLEKYLDEQKMLVTKKGYVENYYGQRVYLPTLKGFNPKKNTFKKDWSKISALRFVNNYLIQSGNAFLLYDGLIKLNEIIKNKQLDVKFLTTVYDSLYLDLSESTDLKEIVSILKECFEVDFFGVKMKIDISGSDTGRWYDWENVDLNFKED